MSLISNLRVTDLQSVVLLGFLVHDTKAYWAEIKLSTISVIRDVGTYMDAQGGVSDRGVLHQQRQSIDAIQELQTIFPTARISVQDADGRGQRDLLIDLGTGVAP